MSEEERESAAAFLQQYDTVRTAERWGDGSAEYYQHLPFRDITGLHAFEWRIKAASYTELLNQLRARNARTVLDVGAGNCWLSYRLWREGFKGAATDIRIDDYDGLTAPRRYWPEAHQWLRARVPFEKPRFAPAAFDAVVFNASLHYTNEPGSILDAYLPLLRPGGALYIVDSPVYRDEKSGKQMMQERERQFREKYNIEMTEATQSFYLTYNDLQEIAVQLSCTLKSYRPKYGLKWALRPLIAKALGRREPASFGVHVFEKG